MSEYSLLNQEFHAFSKSPIKGDQRLSNAVNKSGHTVTSSEIWTDDIPWFTEVSNETNAIKRAKDANYNDIILLASKIYKRKGDKTNGASTGTTFGELWEEYTELNDVRSYALDISAGLVSTIDKKLVQIKNSNDDVVVEYYVGYPIDLLTFENNSNQSSLSAARMFIDKEDGKSEVVEQFVSSTDKIYKGFPSTGYNVLVYTSTGSGNYTKIIEGEHDDDFINNAYAGIIQFNKDRNETHQFAASIYKYVGKKLTKYIKNFDDALIEYNKKIEELESVISNMKNNIEVLENITNGRYDVSRANKNTAPDGSQWNDIIHDANKLKVNYITYDDINNLGVMYGTIDDN